jgi:UDP-GlcNAc:undecaprenyl-phosphate GlcNAc-1-phosphate transferase
MSSIFYVISLVITNFILILFIDKIANFIGIFDKPDGIRKFQIKPVAPIGGILILINLLILLSLTYIDKNSYIFNNVLFKISGEYYLRGYFSLFVTSIIFFVIGLYDDKKDLTPSTKLTLLFFVTLCTILIDETLVVNQLKFVTTNHVIILGNFSFVFTIISFMFLLNSLNLYDGINLQSGINFIIVYGYFLFRGIFPELVFPILVGNIFFLYLNYKNKIYFGDNGIYINSYIIGFIVIKSYNYNINNLLECDEVLLLFLIPTLDAIRLFISRISNLTNPFYGDRNHIHHLLLGRFKNIYIVNTILVILILSPILAYELSVISLIKIITSVILIYSFIITYLKLRQK